MSDRGPFLKLLIAHEGDLRAHIGSVVGDLAAREDVYQDVAVTLWERFGSYDKARPFGAWARGVATRKMLQAHAKDKRFPLAFAPETVERIRDAHDAVEADFGDAANHRKLEALRHCVAALPTKSRKLIDLAYEHRMRGREIARELNTTRDAIYKALARIRTQLESCIRKRLTTT